LKEGNVESSNLWEFVSPNLGLILAILGLAIVLVKFFCLHKTNSIPGALLSKTEIEEAEAAGQRAKEDVRMRFGKHFGGKNT
jgi:hypothetical protein